MPFSTSESNNILNWALGKTGALSAKSKVYIGLLTNDPEASGGTCTELSGDTYARVLISQYNEDYPAVIGTASGRTIKNSAQINWTKAAATWPQVKGIALYTTPTGGSPFYYAKLKNALTVEAGAVALFEAGNLQISFSDTDIDVTTV